MLTFVLAAIAVHAAEPSSQPLFDALRRNDTALVKRALAHGIKANIRDADGVPALMTAALFAGTDAMKLLLDHGADPNAANGTGATALMWAVPDVEKVRLLLTRGASVKARSTNKGRTALLIAAGYPGSTAIVGLLLDKGADLRDRDRND